MFHRAFRIAALATSALAAPAFAQSIPVPPTRELIDENGVDLFRGSYTVDETAASLGGSQGMRYRNVIRGASFTNNIDAWIQSSANTFYVTYGGRTDRFTKSGTTYTPTEANGATLTFNTSTQIYTYTARDGTVVTFNKSLIESYNQYGNEGLVTAIVEPDGQRLDYTYRRARFCQYYEGDFCTGGFSFVRRLEIVKSAYGYALKYFYVSDDLEDGSYVLNWTTVADSKLVNLAVDYCGTLDCTLTQNWPGPNAPNHVVNSYVMGTSGVTGVRRPGSASNDITIAYTSGKVSSVADHAGTTTYAYADNAGSRTVTVTNSLSQISTYVFNIASERLTAFTDPSNNTTSYTYDANARLTRITRPEGNYTQFTYDGRGNVTEVRHVGKAGSGAADIVTTAAFPSTCSNVKTCNQPASTTDARGNATDYTYSTTHGGVLTVTGPAPTAGATRPKQSFTYVTQQAQIKSSTGTIVGTGTNITLPQTVSQCATNATCAGTADEVKTTVTYGSTGVANNLLPTQVASGDGTGALTATTTLGYDIYGNLTAVDGPLTGADDTTTAIYDPGATGSPGIRRVIGTITPDPDGAGGRPASPAATRSSPTAI